MIRALFVFGTRPEAIKVAPVVRAMQHDSRFEPIVAVTAQHRRMLDQVLELFRIEPSHDLDLMTEGQALPVLTARILEELTPVLETEQPDVVIVQGDTTTTFSAALAALYLKIPVAHVEAGYRTGELYLPFPEEANRRLVSRIAQAHYAVNAACRKNLLDEGHPNDSVLVTGNTGIDALMMALQFTPPSPVPRSDTRFRILMTMHRRESWGRAIEDSCRAAKTLVEDNDDVDVVFATHLNPIVQDSARRVIGDSPRIALVPALDYASFAHLLDSADLVMSDSGGVHEEALSLAKPLLLLRDVTEWPEAVSSGAVRLVGTEYEAVVAKAQAALDELRAGARWPRHVSPLSDGKASERIVADLALRFGGER